MRTAANQSWGNQGAPSGDGASTLLATLGGVEVRRDGGLISYTSGLQIDADGSPRAYHPTSSWGRDRLVNAGHPGNWWGILTDNNQPSGKPLLQGEYDPAPGFYISTTSLCDSTNHDYRWNDPRRWVNSETIPFIVLPGGQPQIFNPTGFNGAARLGDFAVVVNLANGRKAAALVADVGPPDHIGEGSIALAAALGVNPDARTGGASGGILTIVFAGSRLTPAWPHPVAAINARVLTLVSAHHLNLPNLPA